MAALIGFFTALPQMVGLAQMIWKYLEKVSNGQPVEYILRSSEAFKLLERAESEEQCAEAARAIRDLIRGG